MVIDSIDFNHNITNIIKYPVLSNKGLELMQYNRYSFFVNKYSNKVSIKTAIENLFNVKVIKVNTCNLPKKKKRFGKYQGYKSQYKKALITVAKGFTINTFA